MKEYYHIIKMSPLFQGIDQNQIEMIFENGLIKKKQYYKGEFIFHAGDPIQYVGIVLSGRVQVIKEDIWGNRTILTNLERGELFGEAFCCANYSRITVSSIVGEASDILLVDYSNIVSAKNLSDKIRKQLQENMMGILAFKNIAFTQKIEILSKRTTKDKILSFLSNQASQQGKNSFAIPFNRQELADYLCVERSALSNELSKLQKAGILSFQKNQFVLIKNGDE